jgi:hypothetical protein
MNNTFCLSIFLALVYFRQLEWRFSAEVTAMLAAEVIMCVMAMQKTMPLWHAIIPMALFPGTLLLVFLLEQVAGLD